MYYLCSENKGADQLRGFPIVILNENVEFNFTSDIDECTTQTDQCVHATCVDTDGGYTCNCETGYQAKAGSDYICEGTN